MSACTIPGCPKPLRARGWCAMHWSRWRRHGDPTDESPRGKKPLAVGARFWSKVRKTESCWLWTGALIRRRYGAFTVGPGEVRYAHRVAYELLVGSIPTGLTLDHLCRNTVCVNPSHLEPVSLGENIRRAAAARRALKAADE